MKFCNRRYRRRITFRNCTASFIRAKPCCDQARAPPPLKYESIHVPLNKLFIQKTHGISLAQALMASCRAARMAIQSSFSKLQFVLDLVLISFYMHPRNENVNRQSVGLREYSTCKRRDGFRRYWNPRIRRSQLQTVYYVYRCPTPD